MILNDEKRILPVSVPLVGEYGISGIAVGVPAKIGEKELRKWLRSNFWQRKKKNSKVLPEGCAIFLGNV